MKAVFEKKDKVNITARMEQGFRGYPPMFHPHCELIYVIKGEIGVTIDGVAEKIKAGDLSITFPYVSHSYEDAKDAETIIILFDTDMLFAYKESLENHKPKCPFIRNAEFLSYMFKKLLLCPDESPELASAYLTAIVGEILPSLEILEIDNTVLDISKKILVYCSNHFNEDISIKSISKALYLSQSYVSKIFTYKLNYRFREYINSLRVQEAKRLLATTDMKIVSIMLECGFENQSSFNRIFNDICHLSPSQYRKKKRSKADEN